MGDETNRAMAAIEEAFYWLERYGSRRAQRTVETTLRNARRMVAPLIKEEGR